MTEINDIWVLRTLRMYPRLQPMLEKVVAHKKKLYPAYSMNTLFNEFIERGVKRELRKIEKEKSGE